MFKAKLLLDRVPKNILLQKTKDNLDVHCAKGLKKQQKKTNTVGHGCLYQMWNNVESKKVLYKSQLSHLSLTQ